MSVEPLVSQQIKSTNKFLWVIRTYLDLLSRNDQLVYGSGLKRLFVLSQATVTFNDTEVQAMVDKAEEMRLIPGNLQGFMMTCILKNIQLYGKELQRVIQNRMVGISNGDVRNPDPLYKFSADEARRHFYTPPVPFIERLLKAIESEDRNAVTLQDIANDAEMLLTRHQIDEGHLMPITTAWGALAKAIEGLTGILELEANYPIPERDYRNRARPALKILWFVAKLLMGDLTVRPLDKDVNLVDIQRKLSFTDGTLAAIPFPLPGTVELFQDNDHHGISLKGRIYLSATSAAAFYRGPSSEDY